MYIRVYYGFVNMETVGYLLTELLMKLSIIVPVYNVEKYLSRCLDSLLNQGFAEDEYEIVCVNDGSTDFSLEICNEYAARHKQIRVLTQENQGVSAARNTGLSAAKADAVCFVDSDDTVANNGLSKAFEFYNDDVEIVRYWCRFIVNGKGFSENPLNGGEYFHGTGYEFIEKHGYCTFCYCYIIRKSFLLNNGIEFKRLKMAEDLLFASTMLLHNPRMAAVSLPIYNYYINPSSATTTKTTEHSKVCVAAFLSAFEELRTIANRANMPASIRRHNEIELQRRLYPVVSRMLTAHYTKKEYDNTIDKIRSLGILPLPNKENGHLSLSRMLMNAVCNSYVMYKIISIPYVNLFVPYILPKLDRNK